MSRPDYQELRQALDQKGTEELQAIYAAHDASEWRPEVFDAIGSILSERGAELPRKAGSGWGTTGSEATAGGEQDPDRDEPLVMLKMGDVNTLTIARSLLEEAGIPHTIQDGAYFDLLGLSHRGPGLVDESSLIRILVRRQDVEAVQELLADLTQEAANHSG